MSRKRSRFDAPAAPDAAAPGGSLLSTAAIDAAQRAAVARAQLAAGGGSAMGAGMGSMHGGTAGTAGAALREPHAPFRSSEDALASLMAIPIKRVTSLMVNDPSRAAPATGSGRPAKMPRMDPDASTAVTGPVNPYLAHRATAAAATGAPPPPDAEEDAAVDPRLHLSNRSNRARLGLHFMESGTLSAAGDAMRETLARKVEVAAVRGVGGRARPVRHAELESPADASGDASTAAASSAVLSEVPPKAAAPVPDLEWWDAAFLPLPRQRLYALKHGSMLGGGKKAAAELAAAREAGMPVDSVFTHEECVLTHVKTWNLIQHPVPIQGVVELQPTSMPIMLTAKERKRARRLARAERLNELRDQQRMGLIPPPEPKVRLSNLMRVLKDAAVADPSAIEARVRGQVAQRIKNHEMRNLAKKLTPAEREEKDKRKLTAHSAYGPSVALFRVRSLVNRKVRFKVDVVAKETYCTGIVLMCRDTDVNLVYVEGGTRAVAMYVSLMTRRLDWVAAAKDDAARAAGADAGDEDGDEDDDDEDDDNEDRELPPGVTAKGVGDGPGSLCSLIWRGTAAKRFYSDFKFEEVRSLAAGRRLMETKGLSHMWDMVVHSARNAAPPGEEVDADSVLGSLAQPTLAHMQAGLAAGGFLSGAAEAAVVQSSAGDGAEDEPANGDDDGMTD